MFIVDKEIYFFICFKFESIFFYILGINGMLYAIFAYLTHSNCNNPIKKIKKVFPYFIKI